LPRALMNGDMTRAAAVHAILSGKLEERDAAREHLVLSDSSRCKCDCIAAHRCIDSHRQAHCGSGALLDKFLDRFR